MATRRPVFLLSGGDGLQEIPNADRIPQEVLGEVGTWTPEYAPETESFSEIAYNLQRGDYVRVGRLIHVEFAIATSSLSPGSASGDVRIVGLPFAPKNDDAGAGIAQAANWDFDTPPNLLTLRVDAAFAGLVIGANNPNDAVGHASVGDLNTASADDQNLIRAALTYEMEE